MPLQLEAMAGIPVITFQPSPVHLESQEHRSEAYFPGLGLHEISAQPRMLSSSYGHGNFLFSHLVMVFPPLLLHSLLVRQMHDAFNAALGAFSQLLPDSAIAKEERSMAAKQAYTFMLTVISTSSLLFF